MDKEFLGERRRALEEKYFAKLNRVLLKRLQDANAANDEAGDPHERMEVDVDESAERIAREKMAIR